MGFFVFVCVDFFIFYFYFLCTALFSGIARSSNISFPSTWISLFSERPWFLLLGNSMRSQYPVLGKLIPFWGGLASSLSPLTEQEYKNIYIYIYMNIIQIV